MRDHEIVGSDPGIDFGAGASSSLIAEVDVDLVEYDADPDIAIDLVASDVAGRPKSDALVDTLASISHATDWIGFEHDELTHSIQDAGGLVSFDLLA